MSAVLRAARDKAASLLSAHRQITKTNASKLDEMEAIFVANATSEALGLEPTQELPDANVVEKLRAHAAVAGAVDRQLEANLEKFEAALRAEESKHKAAVSGRLREVALAPGLDELQTAFDALRNAAINVMAAHNCPATFGHSYAGDDRFDCAGVGRDCHALWRAPRRNRLLSR